MAEAAVLSVALAVGQVIASSLLDPLMQKSLDVVKEEKELVTGLKAEITHLYLKLELIKGVLEDAETKQLKHTNVKSWLVELTEIMYDTDDLLDEYATDVALEAAEADDDHQSSAANTSKRAKVSSIMSCCFTCYGRPDAGDSGHHRRVAVAREIKAINVRLDKILDARNGLGLQELPSSGMAKATFWQSSPETTSILDIDESDVLGRRDEEKRIKEWLLADDDDVGETESNKKIFVLPIVGMGGIGKTTLARVAFHDAKEKSCFELTMWVCVSNRDFDVKKLTSEIIESIYASQGSTTTCNHTTLEALQSVLVKLIEGKRFLLVLDDAWDDNQQKWVNLLKPLKVGGKGSRVIVTTRNKSVADAIIGRMEPVFLTELAKEYLWEIFKTYAFGNRDSSDYAHLERIGEHIVKRLKGSPLAAKTVGRLLNTDLDVKHWRKILKSEFWTLEQDKHEIIPSLMLSYQYLPSNLKQCFTYLSLFPQDYNIDNDDIVHLWVANDFIQKKTEMILEEKGRKCLDYLSNMSLLQQGKGVPFFSMHDLVHDLSESTSKDEYLRIDGSKTKNLPEARIRHLSYFSNNLNSPIMLENIHKYDKLRSLIIEGPGILAEKINISNVLRDSFERMRCLRVLSLRYCSIGSLPDSIGNMKHLRYLDIKGTDIKMLPESLCRLRNLQLLDVTSCEDFHGFPNNIMRLVNLRHLMHDYSIDGSGISGIGKLTALQELDVFRVENRNGHKIGELKHMNMLHGSLEINGLENVESREDAEEASLDQKEFLQELELSWRRRMNDVSDELGGVQPDAMEIETDVLEVLQPSVYLKKLSIKNYNGAKLAAWLSNDSLPYLQTIELIECSKLESIPSLPSIRTMTVHQCPVLSKIAPLPLSLNELAIWNCPNITGLSEEMLRRLTTLETLGIGYCKGLTSMEFQVIPSLKEMEVNNCPNLAFSHSSPSSYAPLDNVTIDSCSLQQITGILARSHPSYLKSLEISWCDELLYFDGELESAFLGLTSLQVLRITSCKNLQALPSDLRGLTSLCRLFIMKCPQMHSLPEMGLPVSIRKLYISDCPPLAERYKQEEGNPWGQQISHIPDIDIR